MNTKFKFALVVVAGAALGAAAMQGLHAQAKPKAYTVTELEVIDDAAGRVYPACPGCATGGRWSLAHRPWGRIVAIEGAAPKRVGINEWDSLEQAQAYRNSKAYKDLAPQRDKAVKIVRRYIVEAEN